MKRVIKSEYLAGIGLYVLAVFAMACMNAIAKYLAQWQHPVEITFWRNAIAFAVIALLVYVRDIDVHPENGQWVVHITRGILGTLAIVFAFTAFVYLPLADAIVLIFTSPLFVAIFSQSINGEPAGIDRLLAIIAGFTGVIIVAQPALDHSPVGLLAGLTSGMCSGLANLYLRNLGRDTSSLPIMFWFLAIGTAMTTPGQLYFTSLPGWELWPLVLAIGLLALVIEFFKTAALRKAPAPAVAPVFYTMLVWNAAFDALIWGHSPKPAIWLGAAVIIGANLWLTWREHNNSAGL